METTDRLVLNPPYSMADGDKVVVAPTVAPAGSNDAAKDNAAAGKEKS